MTCAKVNDKLTKQSKREIAYFPLAAQQYCSEPTTFYKDENAAGRSSFCHTANSLYRYPSPSRSAYSPSRPITGFRLCAPKTVGDIGYHGEIAIHRGADCTNRGAVDITMIGSRLCKRHQSSLRQWQYLVWRVALTTMRSVASPVRLAALWLQKFWAQIVQVQCLQVQQSAYFATTQVYAPAAKIDNRVRQGRAMNESRRRGHTPAAVFAFLGT